MYQESESKFEFFFACYRTFVGFLFTFIALTWFGSEDSLAQAFGDLKSNVQQFELQKKVVYPYDVKPHRLSYSFDNLNLLSGQNVELAIPPSFSARVIDFVYLTHKQGPRDEGECRSRIVGSVVWDCLPGYTSFEVLSKDSRNGIEDWRYWGGAGSGPFNSKFAEVRSGWGETDNLYEWTHYGHHSVLNGQKSFEPLVPAKFRVRSVGPDSIILQEVTVKFLPDVPTRLEEIIFANGLKFGSFDTSLGRTYPGDPSSGNYGHALALNPKSVPRHYAIPQNWALSAGEVAIPLETNGVLSFIDVACGDMHRVPNGGDPEEYRGGGRLSILLRHANGIEEPLMNQENVGTTGVMRAILEKSSHQIGDQLVVRASRDTLQIMGIRFGYQ